MPRENKSHKRGYRKFFSKPHKRNRFYGQKKVSAMDKLREVKGNLDSEPLRIRKFEVGDLVFAKLKGYPPWPSKINQIESLISGGKEKTRYNVYFYGTHQSSILRSSSLYHYDTYAKSIVEKWGRKPKFHDALKELEREMMDKITYLHQLRSTTPDSWCPGFSNACDGLVNEIDGQKTKSKSHCKQRFTAQEEALDDCQNESRKLGYEVTSIERIPFPNTQESLIILSLDFNKDWVKEESARIKEEARMMNCFVSIEPFPSTYKHLTKEEPMEDEPMIPSQDFVQPLKEEPFVEETKEEGDPDKNNGFIGGLSDESDSEGAVETCPVCRLCFFSQTELRLHEESVHGAVSTAESLFDQLVTPNPLHEKTDASTYSIKEGYPLDSLLNKM